jgi:hypothetical protein|tara:strand:- start:268 stop:480 length:213 start_codon:yes stop_codon:yes gene_type:complete
MKKQQFKVGDMVIEKDKSKGLTSIPSVIVSISAPPGTFSAMRQFKIMNLKTGKRFLVSQTFADRYLRVVA